MKSCSIYNRPEGIYVICNNETVEGFLIAAEPSHFLLANSSPIEVGESVRCVLMASQTGVRVPSNLRSLTNAQTSAGFKTWGKFEKGAVLLSATLKGVDTLMLTPHEDYKSGGFVPEISEIAMCKLSADEIGKLVLGLRPAVQGK